jgi:hypothetical protein
MSIHEHLPDSPVIKAAQEFGYNPAYTEKERRDQDAEIRAALDSVVTEPSSAIEHEATTHRNALAKKAGKIVLAAAITAGAIVGIATTQEGRSPADDMVHYVEGGTPDEMLTVEDQNRSE